MLVCVCVFRFYFDLIVHCKLYIYLLLTCDEFNSILSGFIIKYMYMCVCICYICQSGDTAAAARLISRIVLMGCQLSEVCGSSRAEEQSSSSSCEEFWMQVR